MRTLALLAVLAMGCGSGDGAPEPGESQVGAATADAGCAAIGPRMTLSTNTTACLDSACSPGPDPSIAGGLSVVYTDQAGRLLSTWTCPPCVPASGACAVLP